MSTLQAMPENQIRWVDLSTNDLVLSKNFYTRLFGWTTQLAESENESRYTFFLKDGKKVAAVGLQEGAHMPPAWNTCIGVSDVDKIVAVAEDAGAIVAAAPFDLADAGRIAVIIDPTGAIFSVMQPKTMQGFELSGQTGSWCWGELQTRDLRGALRFYSEVFGWDPEVNDNYVRWSIDERAPFAGLMQMPTEVPTMVPPNWVPYFAVENCTETQLQAVDLGASLLVPPTTVDMGTFCILLDPQGAQFAAITMTS